MKIIRRIVKIVRRVEKRTSRFYALFSSKEENPEHARFWMQLAEDEQNHENYAERLLQFNGGGGTGNVIPEPEKILEELRRLAKKVTRIHDGYGALETLSERLAAALKVEAVMLNSAFIIVFQALADHDTALEIEKAYKVHLQRFSQFIDQAGLNDPGLELAAEMLLEMWVHSQKTVRYFKDMTQLESMIPLCSYCKKIRDDAEAWHRLEVYLEKHFKASFSHGICPECAQIYYPGLELYDD